VPAEREGAMFALIPWDVWFAAALCIATVLATIFEPPPLVFLGAYCLLGAYVVIEIIKDEKNI
jgi:hypothetical protein